VGNGSNLLVSDQGYPGLIISTSRFDRLETEGEILRAGSGVLLSKAASLALKCGLTGLEFAAGIPGTVGGACVMNAGAYGSETKDVLLSATVLTPEGQIKRIPAEELELGYRTSCIPGNGYVVLEAEYALKRGEPEAIKARMDELSAKRRPLVTGKANRSVSSNVSALKRSTARNSSVSAKTVTVSPCKTAYCPLNGASAERPSGRYSTVVRPV